ncbi:MAG: hypothetical protein NXY57DRAFT_968732 [Lentinula lateritia]|nr:MAG: hypothetical protein NXY57DRAFT_968732 [Lentinula lateritia]
MDNSISTSGDELFPLPYQQHLQVHLLSLPSLYAGIPGTLGITSNTTQYRTMMEYMEVMGGSIFCEAKQTQDHDRSCEGGPGEWSDEPEANGFDSRIDQLPDRKILFPALWQYSRLSKTIPRERVGKANCVNDSDDTDAHIFDCTTNCYLCHSQNGEAIYKIEEFNNDDGEEDEELVEFVELPVFNGNDDDDDDTFGSTSHSVAPSANPCTNHSENWEQCIHCARERLRAEGWEFPHHEGEGKDDDEGGRGTKNEDKDEQPKAGVHSTSRRGTGVFKATES